MSRQPIRAAAATMAILLIAACMSRAEPVTVLLMPLQPPNPNQTPFTAESHPFTHLKFRNTYGEFQRLNVGYQTWICKMLDEFGQQHAEVVSVQFLSWETALVDIQAGWKSADVLQVPSTWTALLINQNMLASVEPLPREHYLKGLLSTCSLDGQNNAYAVPWIVDFRVLFFRPELTRNPAELATFDGFVKCLERRRDEKADSKGAWQAPFCIALYRNWELMHGPIAYFCQGEILRKERRLWQPVFDEGQARKGLEKLWLLAQNDLVHLVTREEADSPDQGDVLAVGLLEGKWDCILGWPAMRAYFEWQGSPVRAAPLPGLFGKQYQFMGGSHLGVSAAANERGNEQLAKQLVQWLTSYEASVGLFQNTPCLPANARAMDRFIQEHPQWNAFGEIIADGKPYPSIPKWARSVEQDVTLNAFFFMLSSMADKQEWPAVAGQMEAAAAGLKEHTWMQWIVGTIIVVLIAVGMLATFVAIQRRRFYLLLQEIHSKLDAMSQKPVGPPPDEAATEENVFRKAGDYWIVRFRGGDTHYIADERGLHYIAQLLERPYRTISLAQLVAVANRRTGESPGISVEVLGQEGDETNPFNPGKRGVPHGTKVDMETLRACKRELENLGREREKAKADADEARSAAIESEIRQIRAYVHEARENFNYEPKTAYSAVRHAISRALKEIDRSDEKLREHLQRSLKTGQQCSYEPDTPVSWQL